MHLPTATHLVLARILHDRTGLVVGLDKAYLIRHRLEPVVVAAGLASFDALVAELQSASPRSRLFEMVVDAITTRETSFFRDPWFFDAIQKQVLPERLAALRRDGSKRHVLRIWSAGTATGQEAFSLAILVRDLIDSQSAGSGTLTEHHFTIIGTDLSPAAIHFAQDARFTPDLLARGLSDPRYQRHLSRDGQAFWIAEPVRRLIRFRCVNLLNVPSDLGLFDIILCRNVLIYFDEPTRIAVTNALRQRLYPGGWLGLGSAETPHKNCVDLSTAALGRAVLHRVP